MPFQLDVSSPWEVIAALLFLFMFLSWMYIKARVDDEEKEAVEKLGKRKRLKRKVKKVKARVERKIKKGERK